MKAEVAHKLYVPLLACVAAWQFHQRPSRFDTVSFYVQCAIIDGCIPIRGRKAVIISLGCQRSLPHFSLCTASGLYAKQTTDNN